jgi:hypothetical protein
MKVPLILALLLFPALAHAGAADTCIRDRDIDHTEIPNDNTILFHMRDHHIWKNTLQVRCFGLHNEPGGFTYSPTLQGTDLCANQVTIRLNTNQSICQLGDFTRIK